MVFELLHSRVREALKARGIEEPSEPQREAIPLILRGENVLIISPTGTGKTEAAMLPIFSMMLEEGLSEGPGILALYITPLRALNRDLLDRLRWWGSQLGIRVDVRHGDTDVSDRQRQSRNPPHVLITTPETLQAVLTGRRLREHLARLRWIVVDEVHELAEDKRGVQLSLALERLKLIAKRRLQIVGLSATIGSPEEVAEFLVGGEDCKVVKVDVLRNMKLDVVRPRPTEEDVKLSESLYTYPDVVARLRTIKQVVDSYNASLIFVNTRSIAEVLAHRFSMAFSDCPISVHHSSLSKNTRIDVESRLKNGALKAVIATSSLELGIDIGHIDVAVQHMSPHQVTRLVQRVGRSGHRLHLSPVGVVVTDDVNDTMEAIAIVLRARSGWLEPVKIPEKPYDVLAHQVVSLFFIKRRWKVDELYELVGRAWPYRGLALDELKRVLKFLHEMRPRLAYYVEDEGIVVRPRNRYMYEYFYNNLSMIPDERQYLVVNNGEPVGVLDEAFVAEYGNVGTKFIFRGRVWLIEEIDGDVIKVREAEDPVGAIPSWIGEEIPVPYEVARAVGLMRRMLFDCLKERGRELCAGRFAEVWKIDRNTVEYCVEEMEKHAESSDVVPDHETIVVEGEGNTLVVHAALGTNANRAFARVLVERIVEELGLSVAHQQDAYSIVIRTPIEIKPSRLAEVIERLPGCDEMRKILVGSVVRTGLFRWRLIHAARRFGAIRKDFEAHSLGARKLVELFYGTPVFDEAIREVLERDFDLETLCKAIEEVRREGVEVVVREGLSYLGRVAVGKAERRLELAPPEKIERLALESAKNRLLNEALTVYCFNCGRIYRGRVRELTPRCSYCGGEVGATRRYDVDQVGQVFERAARGRTRRDQEGVVEELEISHELIKAYGFNALVGIASRVPVKRLARRAHDVLNADSLEELVKKVLELEKEYMVERFLSD